MSAEALLTGTALESTLRTLGTDGSTGCLVIRDAEHEDAEIYLRDGAIYAVVASGRRATLGARLMSSGALSPDALADALEIQRQELQGWRLGELLVHLGYVDRAVVEAYVAEQVRDALDDLLHRPGISTKFRRGKKTRQDVAPPTSVDTALAEVAGRRAAWDRVVAVTGGATGVPQLSAGAPAGDDVVLDSNDWAVLTRVDGVRTIEALAIDCGFTLSEAGRVVVHLIEAGVVEVARAEADPDPVGPQLDEDDAGDDADSGPVPQVFEDVEEPAAAVPDDIAVRPDVASFAAALDRVAASLAGTAVLAEQAQAADDTARLDSERAEQELADEAARVAAEEAERRSDLEAEQHRHAREEWHDVELREQERVERDRLDREEAERVEQAEQAEQDELAEQADRARHQIELLAEAAAATALHEDAADTSADPEWESAQSATAMLRELGATSVPAPAVPQQTSAAPDRDAPAETDDEAAQSSFVFDRGDTDTASLLRELSSLGFGDEGPPTGPKAPAPRPAQAPPPPPPRKRKGLFGR